MWNYAGLTDRGIYDYKNDDRILCGTEILSDGALHGQQDKYYIACVFDGVGGRSEGFRAAQISAETLSKYNHSGLNRAGIRQMLEEVNQVILQAQQEYHIPDGMRTTVAGIYADDSHFFVFNAGDSRVYQFRENHLEQLSKDHSFVQDLVDSGEITPEEAMHHPKKNVIFKCIGHEEALCPRIMNFSGDFLNGDIILLCSDGISDVMTLQQLEQILKCHQKDLSRACTVLRETAIQLGSHDNLSVLLIQKKEGE